MRPTRSEKQTKEWFVKNIRVRSNLSVSDIENKWIMMDALCVINVSSNFNKEVYTRLQEQGIRYFWFPMSELNGDMGLHSIYGALCILRTFVESKVPCIIHCFGGNNRSVVIYESLYYLCFASWPKDAEGSVVFKNCQNGHLPSLNCYEDFISRIRENLSLEKCLESSSINEGPNFCVGFNDKYSGLNELQISILETMFEMNLCPDRGYRSTSKVVMNYFAKNGTRGDILI